MFSLLQFERRTEHGRLKSFRFKVSIDASGNHGICDMPTVPGQQVIHAVTDANGDMKSIFFRLLRNKSIPKEGYRQFFRFDGDLKHSQRRQYLQPAFCGKGVST